MEPTKDMIEEATKLSKALEMAGDAIEQLNVMGCVVSLTVWHNEGSEGMILHQLNGEFEEKVLLAVPVEPTP